jgi:hypothetical protein
MSMTTDINPAQLSGWKKNSKVDHWVYELAEWLFANLVSLPTEIPSGKRDRWMNGLSYLFRRHNDDFLRKTSSDMDWSITYVDLGLHISQS